MNIIDIINSIKGRELLFLLKKDDTITQAIFQAKFENLPDELKLEVIDFINFLYYKIQNKSNMQVMDKRNGYGCLKSKISMSEDFDEPLDDLKDYM